MTGTSQAQSPPSPKPKESDSHRPPASLPTSSSCQGTKELRTRRMGSPAVPSPSQPDNRKAGSWKADDDDDDHPHQIFHHPYIQCSPIQKPTHNPFEPAIHCFNMWSMKAETIARNIWNNLKMGGSVSETARGKVKLSAKAMTRGGFESLYKQTFVTDPNERLKNTFACYLSTSTGPVPGTLYLSTARLAFCSDRVLSFTAPSGKEAWSYYKVMIPLRNVGTVNPVTMLKNPLEKYIQISTVDGHEFWFMAFVNFEKATGHLLSSVSEFRAYENGVQPEVGGSSA